jgi:hypothetical protein
MLLARLTILAAKQALHSLILPPPPPSVTVISYLKLAVKIGLFLDYWAKLT